MRKKKNLMIFFIKLIKLKYKTIIKIFQIRINKSSSKIIKLKYKQRRDKIQKIF